MASVQAQVSLQDTAAVLGTQEAATQAFADIEEEGQGSRPAVLATLQRAHGVAFGSQCEVASGTLPRAWRLPAQGRDLPLYVQRDFWIKTFALLGIQLAAILGEMVATQQVLGPLRLPLKPADQWKLLGALAACMLSLLGLNVNMSRHPVNYLMLVLSTGFVGTYLGMVPHEVHPHMHSQVVAMLAMTMILSAVVVSLLARCDLQPQVVLAAAGLVSWMAALGVNMLAVHVWKIGSLAWALVAALVAFAVLAGVLFMLHTGHLLLKCDSDKFFGPLLAMDACLLLTVLPLLLLSLPFKVTQSQWP